MSKQSSAITYTAPQVSHTLIFKTSWLLIFSEWNVVMVRLEAPLIHPIVRHVSTRRINRMYIILCTSHFMRMHSMRRSRSICISTRISRRKRACRDIVTSATTRRWLVRSSSQINNLLSKRWCPWPIIRRHALAHMESCLIISVSPRASFLTVHGPQTLGVLLGLRLSVIRKRRERFSLWRLQLIIRSVLIRVMIPGRLLRSCNMLW